MIMKNVLRTIYLELSYQSCIEIFEAMIRLGIVCTLMAVNSGMLNRCVLSVMQNTHY